MPEGRLADRLEHHRIVEEVVPDLHLPAERRPLLEEEPEVLAPVARHHDLGPGGHDLRDVGAEVLDLLERVVFLADDLLARGLDPVELLLETVRSGPAEVVILVQQVELPVLPRRQPAEVDGELARVHVGVQTAPEGRLEELFAGQLPRLRPGRAEDLPVLGRDLRDRLGDVGAGVDDQEIHLVAEDEIVGPPGGDVGLQLAVRHHDLERPAEHPPRRVHALRGEPEGGDVAVADILHRPALWLHDPELDRPRLGPSGPHPDEGARGRSRRDGPDKRSPGHLSVHRRLLTFENEG